MLLCKTSITKKSLRPMKNPKTDYAHFTLNHAGHSTVPILLLIHELHSLR